MNPRDFRKAAPYLGALLLAAVVFVVVRLPDVALRLGDAMEAERSMGLSLRRLFGFDRGEA
jgi:hypothetical protein